MNGDGPFGVPRPDETELCDKLDALNLTDEQVNRVLIFLKTKEIDEQIRSNKVIEGVLRDIHAAIQTIADKE